MAKQNLTVSLPRQTIRKAKVLAARRGSASVVFWLSKSSFWSERMKPTNVPSAKRWP